MFNVNRLENRRKISPSFTIRALVSCPPISSAASFKLKPTMANLYTQTNSAFRIPTLYIQLPT